MDLFPRDLLGCIVEGRDPRPSELDSVTAKVIREVFPGPSSPSLYALAKTIAQTALVGTRLP